MKSFLHDKFYEGRNPPSHLHPESQDSFDWWNEQVRRCFEGFSFRGTRITGDMYWYLNFFPIMRLVDPSNARATVMDMPWASQDDDWLTKQFEEAEQEGMHTMFFTARGYGKTYLVISIGAKYYFLQENSHNIFSASSENHIKETYNNKLLPCVDEINKNYAGLISLNTAKRDETDLISGFETTNSKGEKIIAGHGSRCERIIYGNKEGATKGRRPTTQLFEEVGDWSGAAKLKQCFAASEGSWYRGDILTCRVFFIGTGGQMSSGGSRDAKDMFYNPEAFNLYAINEWKKKTAIFISSDRKYGGHWEQTGISNRETAMDAIMKKRKAREADPVVYFRLLQEYPLTPEECFLVTGTNIFPQAVIAGQLVALDTKVTNDGAKTPEPKRYELEWIYESPTSSKVTGVKAVENKSGTIQILEHPQRQNDGSHFKHLYIAGYDGIDIGRDDSETGKGSNAALYIKKRFISGQSTNNLYVCRYVDRPNDIEESYENVLKLSWYYNCQINIEFSRVRIIGFFRARKQGHRLMKRPTITVGDAFDSAMTKQSNSNLVGTIMNPKMKDYGQQALANYFRSFGRQFWFREGLEQLRDYTPDEQTYFDDVVALMLTEIADEEMMAVPAREAIAANQAMNFGFYTDQTGVKRYGVIPGQQLQPAQLYNQLSPFQLYSGTNAKRHYSDMINAEEPEEMLYNVYKQK